MSKCFYGRRYLFVSIYIFWNTLYTFYKKNVLKLSKTMNCRLLFCFSFIWIQKESQQWVLWSVAALTSIILGVSEWSLNPKHVPADTFVELFTINRISQHHPSVSSIWAVNWHCVRQIHCLTLVQKCVHKPGGCLDACGRSHRQKFLASLLHVNLALYSQQLMKNKNNAIKIYKFLKDIITIPRWPGQLAKSCPDAFIISTLNEANSQS